MRAVPEKQIINFFLKLNRNCWGIYCEKNLCDRIQFQVSNLFSKFIKTTALHRITWNKV